MNLKEAAQQALEALESVEPWEVVDHDPFAAAISALRAALAEDVPETNFGNMAQAVDCYGDGNVYRGQRSSDSKIPTLTINGMPAVEGPLSKAQRTGQESPQVEPVAFIHKNFERRIREVLTEADFGGDKLAFLKYCMSDGNLLPLYTAPPQREPLTESFLEELAEKHVTHCYFDTLTYAREIERLHGVGGKE